MTAKIEGIEEEDLRRMYEEESMSQSAIAGFYSVGRHVIENRMQEYKIARRTKNERIEGIEEDVLRRMYEDYGIPTSDIAEYYGVHKTTILRRLEEYGIKKRPLGEAIRIEGIEKEDLRRMYEDYHMTIKTIAKHYDTNHGTIWNRMKKYDIDRRRKRGNTGGIKEEDLKRMYVIEGMNIYEIADQYDVAAGTIQRRMQEYGIDRRSKSETMRQNAVNEAFFETWTQKSAWVYGWFFGDGSSDRYQLGFNLSRKDKEVLYKIKNAMGSEHRIYDRDSYAKLYSKIAKMSLLRVYSKKLVSDLQELDFHDVPNELLRDFFRGFFEADGGVSWSEDKRVGKGYICTTFAQKEKDVLTYIWHMISNLFDVVDGGYLGHNGKVWQLVFSESDSISLYHFLYDNCDNLFLDRKKKRFEELMARKGYT